MRLIQENSRVSFSFLDKCGSNIRAGQLAINVYADRSKSDHRFGTRAFAGPYSCRHGSWLDKYGILRPLTCSPLPSLSLPSAAFTVGLVELNLGHEVNIPIPQSPSCRNAGQYVDRNKLLCFSHGSRYAQPPSHLEYCDPSSPGSSWALIGNVQFM